MAVVICSSPWLSAYRNHPDPPGTPTAIEVSIEYQQKLVNVWSLPSTCAIYRVHEKIRSTPRPPGYYLDLISEDPHADAARIYGFSEYSNSFHIAATVRPSLNGSTELARCGRRRTGMVIYYSANNLWHQLFHMVPAWEVLRSLGLEARRHMMQRCT